MKVYKLMLSNLNESFTEILTDVQIIEVTEIFAQHMLNSLNLMNKLFK